MLSVLRGAVEEVTDYANRSFRALDARAARRIEPIEEVVDDLVAATRSSHIKRLREGTCTLGAGVSFLDMVVNIERISDQCSNIGLYTLSLSDSSVMSDRHDYIRRLHQGGDPEFDRWYAEARETYFKRLNGKEERES